MTQEALARKLDVTNQAVSKWESGQCCPDISLLPRIADIFGITMDELFGRAKPLQLMNVPQTICYLLQINHWLAKFHVRLEY